MSDPWLRQAIQEWIAADVDPAARAELAALLDLAMDTSRPGAAEALADLEDRMSGMPAFGTAGLRGRVRAGPNGMNRSVVIRTTAGLVEWLRDHGYSDGIVVVGRDARHGSNMFATDTAAVFAAAGFDVRLLPEPLPTPVLAHATRALDAVVGVQITASHNPPRDNGYKVYLAGGSQLVSPVESEVETAIAGTSDAIEIPRAETWTLQHTALNNYLARVATLPRDTPRDLRIAATALHGVGAEPLRQALEAAGFTDVHFVAAQTQPDPDFPTVTFPNPEEPGAADAVLALAEEIDADIAVALDPDADRCAVGIRGADGPWRVLTGDETGSLLGEHIISRLDRTSHPDPLVASTIVSSTMLRSIATGHGIRYDETLTGFKWLVRAGDGRGTGLVYAYEEALGHCVDPDYVRDKDGIATAVLVSDLAASTKAAGTALEHQLAELETTYGVHATGQVSARIADHDSLTATMRRFRSAPPRSLAGVSVAAHDLLPDSDVVLFTGENIRVVVRPSGTEPKLKCYSQVVRPVVNESLASARQHARRFLSELQAAISEFLPTAAP